MTEAERISLDAKLVQVVPTERQIRHQQMEFYGFVHFTVNTFTGEEWGFGTESESVFNPTELDAEQWAKAAKEGGMTGLILTCKHHDGFCLWPSRMTSHSVINSPYKDGKGDVVKELSEACKKYGLKFGIYLSPWDRNNAKYGQGKAYDDYFVAQLTELLTWYGPVFCVWFDGACGEGPNGKKQKYDWIRYYTTIRELQPDACINVSGPDIRWCGNEAGVSRPSEWSVVPEGIFDQDRIMENSQQEDNVEFRERTIVEEDQDLGSRKVMEKAGKAIWYPAEVDTSIRPGWFYHAEEDDKVKSLEELKKVYLGAVGGNGMLLLNLPPDKRGLFHDNDVKRLKELGDWIRATFNRAENLALKGTVTFGENEEVCSADCVLEDSYESFWQPQNSGLPAELSVEWKSEQAFKYIVLKENIKKSQRIETFEIWVERDGNWEMLQAGTTVGYQKIVELPETVTAQKLKVRITDSRQAPTISYFGVFSEK